MMLQRLIAVAMILGSSVLTAWASGDIAFPAILGMLGLLGVQRWFTWNIRPERHFVTSLLLLLLAVLFAFQCRYAHVRADQAAAFAWQTIARYFLASMILILFLRPHRTGEGGQRTEGRRQMTEPFSVFRPLSSGLPPSLGLFHLASVLAAGQVLLLDDRYVAFRLVELFSVTLVILYAMAGPWAGGVAPVGWGLTPRGRSAATGQPREARPHPGNWLGLWLPLSLLLLVAVNLGWIGGSLLFQHVEVINFLPGWLSRGGAALETTSDRTAQVGFTASGELSTIVEIKEAEPSPALTITGSNPTYLRAKAFATYRQGTWHELQSWEGIPPEQNASFGMLLGRTSLYRLNDAEASWEMTIRHESALPGDCMFTPLGTCFVEAPFSPVERNDDDVVQSHNVRLRQSYTAGFTSGGTGRPPSSLQLHHLRELPKELDLSQIRPKANRIFARCTTTAQKIDAVTQYFHTNFTYVLGLDVPKDQDPLNYFLLKASTGYCEYFASGAVILLRLAGVPARYVTGFLVTERGEDGRSWMARNTDAHAWAEAWDQERGQWVIVEATTQEGLDDTSLADELVRSAGSKRPFLTRLVQSLYDYGLFGVIGQFFVSYGLLTGMTLCVVFLGAAAWVAVRRRRHPFTSARRPLSADVLVLHRLLTAMDRKARTLGYRRHPGETLHGFAARLSTGEDRGQKSEDGMVLSHPSSVLRMADWYMHYAGLRYASAIDPAGVEQLHQDAQKLRGHPNGT